MSSAVPEYIYKKLNEFIKNNDINVKLYRSRNPFSKALGYFTPSRPLDINLNTRKINRSDSSIVGTLIHELVHMTDNADNMHSYGHGNNSPTGKSNTAPYWIGNLAKTLIDGDMDFNNTENVTYIYKKPLLKRIANFFKRLF